MAVFDANGNELNLKTPQPVPLSTVNAMLACAYTYTDACRAGDLSYGDGTGTSQAEGKICCSTFCRQILQGIPYNDYLPGNASTTTKSGNRWQYGYRMLGTDYYKTDATTTAQQMYDQHFADGRAFPTDYKLEDALPGDLIVFGQNLQNIRHIGLFVYKDAQGKNYIMDSNIADRNGNIAVRVHEAYDHTLAYSNNPVGIIRPYLSQANIPIDDVAVSASNGAITGSVLDGYAHFLKILATVTEDVTVTYGSLTYTPNYSGKDFREFVITSREDTQSVMSYSGATISECEMSHYM